MGLWILLKIACCYNRRRQAVLSSFEPKRSSSGEEPPMARYAQLGQYQTGSIDSARRRLGK